MEKRGAIISGPFGSNIGRKFFVKDGVPVIRGNNISEKFELFKDDGFVFVSKNKAEELGTWAIEDDLIFTAAGTLGQVGIIPKKRKFDKYIISNKQMRARLDKTKVLPFYAFLWFKTGKMVEYIKSRSTGSTIPLINLSVLRSLPISVPPIAEQKGIVMVIMSLSNKIELNQKMNKILEAIAQSIFKHWFIDFEFPNEEGKPYKSSKGEMVDSELGEIPKGWNIRKLGDLGKIVCGKTPSTKDETNFGQDVPFITIPDMRGNVFTFKTERYLSTKGANSQETKFLPPLSVCVSCIATPGLVTLTSTTSQTNQQINSIICKEGVSPFYVYFVSKEKSQEIINKGLGGTATLNLNTSEFSNLKVILPDPVTLRNFHDFTTQFFKKILNNSKEILVLTDIRDSLLPRLMTGKIRVPLED